MQQRCYIDPNCTLNWGANNIDADPLFVDPTSIDFHLTWLSPCINRGTNDGAPSEDMDGDPRPYMGTVDIARQQPNVFRMKLLGAEVVPVTSGRGTLKDAMNDALRDWVTNVRDTFYCIGTVAGPHPYPAMVRDFQSIIGKEAKEQILKAEGRLPDGVIACVGGGSNFAGICKKPIKNENAWPAPTRIKTTPVITPV